MAPQLDYTTRVSTTGYAWVSEENWNMFDGKRVRVRSVDKPKWRVRLPWNSPDPPALLLRPTQVVLGGFAPKGSGGAGEETSISLTGKNSALYRNFAQLEPRPEAIEKFANRFGMLWDSEIGIPFAEWEYEIRTMKWLVDIWDAAVNQQTALLAERFPKLRGGFQCLYDDTILGYTDYQTGHSEFYVLTKERRTLQETAREYLIQALNVRLQLAVQRLQLKPILLTALGETAEGFLLALRPDSLLSAMWVQFADAIAAEKRYRPCEACQQYIELSPDVNRADRRYCSDACRNRAMRKRQKLAQQMREKGSTLKEISRVICSDIKTIKQWVDPKGQTKKGK